MVEIKKYLNNKKGVKSRVFLMCKKTTAMSCAIGLVMIMNAPLVSAYEAHTVNITAKIVNDIPGINPPGGDFCNDGRLEVELNVTLENADICYTTDGVDPVCESDGSSVCKLGAEYYTPFEIPNGITTVKAVACHEELRNAQLVVVQSALMTKEFDASVPSVTVTSPVDGATWYCDLTNPNTYPIEWTIENYRDVNELSVDIVYITDNDGNGIISEGDNNFSIANNLSTGATGSYPFVLTEDYCYYGYGWAKVTVTEASTNPDTDNCKGFGVSGKIFDPMASNDSCNNSVSGVVPIIPEPAISENNNVPDNTEDILSDNSEEETPHE